MKDTKEMYAGGFYLFTGEASANSCFVENLREAKIFIKIVDRYLSKYVKVHEYLLTAESWMIQVRLRSRKDIIEAYEKKREMNGRSIDVKIESWRIVSEQVRLMLAFYVKATNKMEGREGGKVKESYKRYYFESAREASEIIGKMKNQKIRLLQRNIKYQRVKSHYTIPKKMGKGHVFLCSRDVKKKQKELKKIGVNSLIYSGIGRLLVGEYVNLTLKTHKTQKSP